VEQLGIMPEELEQLDYGIEAESSDA